MMPIEQKLKITGTALLALIAAAVLAIGTTKAIDGTSLYMTAVEGKSDSDALLYALMVVGISILASNAAVFMESSIKRYAFTALAVVMAGLTIYTAIEGKAHDSDTRLAESSAADRQIIVNEIAEYQAQINALNDSLIKNVNSGMTREKAPEAQTCTPGRKNFSRCNAERTKQMQAAGKLLEASGQGAKTLQTQLDNAALLKTDAEKRLVTFDNAISLKKQQKRHESLLTMTVSSALPELASLLGSFLLNFFLKTMYMIFREKHTVQLAVQCGTVGGTVRYSELYQPETAATRSDIDQWSAIPNLSPVQQTAATPHGAEVELAAAIDTKTAPLTVRTAKDAYPLIARRRITEIFEEKFTAKTLNCRIDGKGNRNWEYPADDEEGGNTFYTETARARRETPAPTRAIYLAINNQGATA